MRNPEFYRHSISKRAAVDIIVKINKALSQFDSVHFYGYQAGNQAGQYDSAAYAMVSEIQRLKQEVEEYRKLKAALRPIIKGVR